MNHVIKQPLFTTDIIRFQFAFFKSNAHQAGGSAHIQLLSMPVQTENIVYRFMQNLIQGIDLILFRFPVKTYQSLLPASQPQQGISLWHHTIKEVKLLLLMVKTIILPRFDLNVLLTVIYYYFIKTFTRSRQIKDTVAFLKDGMHFCHFSSSSCFPI